MKLSRRDFIKSASLAAISTAASTSSCIQPKKNKPNVIYILSDDLGYGDLGCYGQEKIKTPHLDALAKSGLRFTDHYAGSTVCAPSRCSLMTGKHGGHCTVRGNVDVLMKADEMTVAKVMKNAGYSTACIGKWGIGHPPPPEDPHNNGFDYFFGYLSMWHAHNYYPEFLWKNGEKVQLNNVGKHVEKHYKEGQEELTGYGIERNDYTSDLYTNDALEWISQQEGPFFLFLSYTIPHANNEALELGGEHGMEVPDLGLYKDKDWPEAEKGKAAMISRMDSDIGQINEKLQQLGILKNTLVLFTSDNGPHKEGGVDPEFFNSSGDVRGTKRDLYDGGIRVPMIASWPDKIMAGSETDHISAFWDILPTLAELTAQPMPENIDGLSFLPTLNGEFANQKQHAYLYWEFHEGSSKQALRIGQYKVVRNAPSGPIEVYDVSKDLKEQHNIADQHPDLVAKSKEIFSTVRTDEDIWPLQDNQDIMPF
jgi:arylsulfatase A-like enzyme